MTLLYLDTSALLRLYTQEPEHERVRPAVQEAGGVVCHQITYVEALSALAGRERRKLIGAEAYRSARAAFQTDWETFSHVGVSAELLREAAELAETHGLRTYDAVHLAAARLVSPLGLTFMTFDRQLREAASRVLPGQVWRLNP